MQKLSELGSPRLVVTFPQEMKDWLTERSNNSGLAQAEIVRDAVQLLIDLGWKAENEN